VSRRAVRQAWGRGRRAEWEDQRAKLLQMCEFVQHSAHMWSGFNDQPLCVNAAALDFHWRAILALAPTAHGAKTMGSIGMRWRTCGTWLSSRCATPRQATRRARPRVSTTRWSGPSHPCPSHDVY
jgi:hypothetical protein